MINLYMHQPLTVGDKQMFFNFNSRPMNNLFLSPELPDMDSSLSCSSGYVIDIC